MERTAESIRGGSSLFGQVDQALLLGRVKNHETQRRLGTRGRYDQTPRELLIDYVPKGSSVMIDGKTPRHYVSLGTPQQTDDNTLTARIRSALRTSPRTTQALVELTGSSRKKVDKLMNHLLKKDVVKRDGAGRKGDPHIWKLSPKRRDGGQS